MAILTTVSGYRTDAASQSLRSRTMANASVRFGHYITRPILKAGPLLYAAAVVGLLAVAWLYRDEGHLTAESGLGYWLGIIGGVIILLLLGYPLRKRLTSSSRLGRVSSWFRLHMIFGILGPALVVLHTNFRLGSLNSRLALYTMLIVVASGIVGRYLYAKVHRGLYGQQTAMRDVLSDITSLKMGLGDALGEDESIMADLELFAPSADRVESLPAGVWSCLTSGFRTRAARGRIMRRARILLQQDVRITSRKRRRLTGEIGSHLRIYFAAVKKAERLALFERIFGLWHHLHLPLFIMLLLTVALHIFAVHRY